MPLQPVTLYLRALLYCNLLAIGALIISSFIGGYNLLCSAAPIIQTFKHSIFIFACYFLWHVPVLSKRVIIVWAPILLSIALLMVYYYQSQQAPIYFMFVFCLRIGGMEGIIEAGLWNILETIMVLVTCLIIFWKYVRKRN
jgi:hypothetical protein